MRNIDYYYYRLLVVSSNTPPQGEYCNTNTNTSPQERRHVSLSFLYIENSNFHVYNISMSNLLGRLPRQHLPQVVQTVRQVGGVEELSEHEVVWCQPCRALGSSPPLCTQTPSIALQIRHYNIQPLHSSAQWASSPDYLVKKVENHLHRIGSEWTQSDKKMSKESFGSL
jgi:hypothetical protein